MICSSQSHLSFVFLFIDLPGEAYFILLLVVFATSVKGVKDFDTVAAKTNYSGYI